MVQRAVEFRRVPDKAAVGGRARYLFLGDLNTMGMEYRYVPQSDVTAETEILKLTRQANARRMRLLSRDEVASWWGGGQLPASNLDHAVAADHLQSTSVNGAEITVGGWPKLPTIVERLDGVHRFSDHGLLYFEVHKAAQ